MQLSEVGGRDGEHRDSGYEDGIRTTPWRISLAEDGPICGNALKAAFRTCKQLNIMDAVVCVSASTVL